MREVRNIMGDVEAEEVNDLALRLIGKMLREQWVSVEREPMSLRMTEALERLSAVATDDHARRRGPASAQC
jgi:hypothetical protein